MPSLSVFNIRNNKLSGTLPAAWGAWPNIRDLRLASNRLSSTLPAEYGSWANIEQLALGEPRSLNTHVLMYANMYPLMYCCIVPCITVVSSIVRSDVTPGLLDTFGAVLHVCMLLFNVVSHDCSCIFACVSLLLQASSHDCVPSLIALYACLWTMLCQITAMAMCSPSQRSSGHCTCSRCKGLPLPCTNELRLHVGFMFELNP